MTGWRYFLSILILFCLTSCAPATVFVAGTVAGISGYKYYQGALSVVYQAPYEKTFKAAVKVLEDMKFNIVNKEQDIAKGSIESRRADGKPVTISVKYRSTNETDVKIRVGYFGDEGASNVIKERIARELFR